MGRGLGVVLCFFDATAEDFCLGVHTGALTIAYTIWEGGGALIVIVVTVNCFSCCLSSSLLSIADPLRFVFLTSRLMPPKNQSSSPQPCKLETKSMLRQRV